MIALDSIEIVDKDLINVSWFENGNHWETWDSNDIFNHIVEQQEEIERLNNKIKRIVYQCYKSDMSYEEFKRIWVNAMGKIYEPSQIDELEKELGVDKK